jgi:hypothetical protein
LNFYLRASIAGKQITGIFKNHLTDDDCEIRAYRHTRKNL